MSSSTAGDSSSSLSDTAESNVTDLLFPDPDPAPAPAINITTPVNDTISGNVSIPWLFGNTSIPAANATNSTVDPTNGSNSTIDPAVGNITNSTIPLTYPNGTSLVPTPTIAANTSATNSSSAAPSKTTVYVTKTDPNGVPKTVQTVVDVVHSGVNQPGSSHDDPLPLGPIIGGVAGGLVALVILVWLLSIPLRRMGQKRDNPNIDWQTFPAHHTSRHGVGEGEEDDDDDGERPINSAVAVLGPGALASRSNSVNRDPPQRSPYESDENRQWNEGYEMAEAANAMGPGGAAAPYGVTGLYPYSHLDGGFDPEHAARYQQRSIHSGLTKSPSQHSYGAGTYDSWRMYSPHPDPPPPWQPTDGYSEVQKSPPLSPGFIYGNSPVVSPTRPAFYQDRSPVLDATRVQHPDQFGGLNVPTPVAHLQRSASSGDASIVSRERFDHSSSLSSHTAVGSPVASKSSRSNLSSFSGPPSLPSSVNNSPEQAPLRRVGQHGLGLELPPQLPPVMSGRSLTPLSASFTGEQYLTSQAVISTPAGNAHGRAPLVANVPLQQFHRPRFMQPEVDNTATRDSVLPSEMERLGALRVTNAQPEEEDNRT